MSSTVTTRSGESGTAHIPLSATSHPDDPVPGEPPALPHLTTLHSEHMSSADSPSSSVSIRAASESEGEGDAPSTPGTEPFADDAADELDGLNLQEAKPSSSSSEPRKTRRRRASTILISQNSEDVQKILGNSNNNDNNSTASTTLVEKFCCGGGCCKLQPLKETSASASINPVIRPKNKAFDSLNLYLGRLSHDSELTHVTPLPEKTVSFAMLPSDKVTAKLGPEDHPPRFVQPHPPHEVYRAPLHHARELTKPGAEKRTYHFDLDVTDYPAEGGNVDFVVGGAIGVCPRNPDDIVDEVFDLIGAPRFVRDKKVMMRTTGGRWPTVWGDEEPRELLTTRRELLTWCIDLQSYPPTKPLLRLLGEYAADPDEKKILMYLSSAQGQASFCDLRTGPYVTVPQLLHAFPSSQPPLDHFLSVLSTLMPRFYSLSQDPLVSDTTESGESRRLIEVAVTVHESPDWRGGDRTGVGSGFLERVAQQLLVAEQAGTDAHSLDLHLPIFRGLMANPLAREFVLDGPMLLIGAGVGVAPFRGFVQRRLKNANCANKVWVLQGVRDSLLDELYSGEWGVHECEVRKVVQSRRGESRYVQEEVRHQADLVWFVINSLDGRVFVCGSSKGMGEGVEAALIDVAMAKGSLNRHEAELFWQGKQDGGQYIAVCLLSILIPRGPNYSVHRLTIFVQETW